MADKEYEVSYNKYTETYTIKEVKSYDYSSEPNTDPTMRESLGEKMLNASRGKKMFFTFFFDLYGFFYRFGSNSSLSVIFSLLQLFTINLFGIIWIIDSISIVVKNDIVMFGRIKYKDYVPKRK